MTHEIWIKMTENEQRIKVAELVGWTEVETIKAKGGWDPDIIGLPPWLKKHPECPPIQSLWKKEIPNYIKDLNAMHEAVNKLSDANYNRFCDVLWNLCDGASGKTGAINATAEQRAKAFVLTLEDI